MRREEFRAMGTTISLLLPENQAGLGIQIVRTLFAVWEQTLSRFLPDSELSQLNQHAGTPTPVSDLLYYVLATALTAAQATKGVYDPAMLDQLVQLVQHGRIIHTFCGLGCGERSRQDVVEQVADGSGCTCVLIELRQLTIW